MYPNPVEVADKQVQGNFGLLPDFAKERSVVDANDLSVDAECR
jgi:hypothetical protein